MNRYPLLPFLIVLRRREKDAQQAVIQARKRVATFEAALQERIRELEHYRAWCLEEETRLFADVLGKPVAHQKLMNTRAQIAWNEAQVPVYEGKVRQAELELSEEQKALAQCMEKQQAASREVYKVESHQSMWQAESLKEMEAAEEAMNEENAETAFSYKKHA